MTVSQFDPATFLDATTTEESIKRPPLDAGDYTGLIKSLTPRTWTSDKPDAKVKSGVAFDVLIDVEVPADQQSAKGLTPTLSMRDSIMLEVNAGGNIDYSPGKNGNLRRYRDATGMNKPGVPFAPKMLAGQVVKVKVGHRIYEGEIYDEVSSVAVA